MNIEKTAPNKGTFNMNYTLIYYILAFLISFLFNFFTMPKLLKICYKKRLYDVPDARKVHNILVPRLGGILFLPSTLIAMSAVLMARAALVDNTIELNQWTFIFLTGIFIIYIIGVLDDLIGLGANIKFAVQLVTALAFPLSGVYINNLYGLFGIHEIPFYIGYFITVFCTLFIINAMNLIDGIDGLASGIAAIALSGYTILFATNGIEIYPIFCVSVITAILVFMYFNIFGDEKKQTKTFMGDTGSLTLGYIISFLAIKYAMNNENILPYRPNALLVSYSILLIPVFDVARVILYRLRKHKPLFGADKSHIHHKLLRTGMSQHKVLITIYSIVLFFIVLNYVMSSVINITIIVVLDIILWTSFNLWLDKKIKA